MKTGCTGESLKGKRRCYWHFGDSLTIERQVAAADRRLARTPVEQRRSRVPASEWPAGTRFCAGCQDFPPLWYCRGSRCRACASRAQHEAMVLKTYGLQEGEYRKLYAAQHGRCYICRRRPQGVRLAVDHDHQTGEVRGLLCAGSEHGCNKGLGFFNDDLELLRRAVAYLEDPPARRVLT